MIRLASGIVLAAAALSAILFLSGPALRFVTVAIACLATHEFLRIARATEMHPSPPLTYAFVVIVCWSVSTPPASAELLLATALGALLVEVLWQSRPLADAAAVIAAGVYIGLPLGSLVAIHGLGGREAVLLLLGTIVASDSAQYYSGRMFGRHLLAPKVSPKKTIEGAVGGGVFGIAVMAVAGSYVFPATNPVLLGLLGLVVVLLGICGDLFESRLKRIAGVKDSSSLIPGHGGVLDRIDALLFATPAFYLFVRQLT